jgi:hypothetical protein
MTTDVPFRMTELQHARVLDCSSSTRARSAAPSARGGDTSATACLATPVAWASPRRRARRLPISSRLLAVLEMRRLDPTGKPQPAGAYVFGNRIGERSKSIKTAWANARKAAGLVGFQLRDLMHEAASRFEEAGVLTTDVSKFPGTPKPRHGDHDQPVAANLLDRQFEAAAPNQRWVGDTTEFVIGTSQKVYLAVILDLFSRFVVGWAISAVNDRHFTIKALEMALKRRCPDSGLLHHSDQGCTYASAAYQAVLDAHGIVCSMSRRGNCHDNAVMECFFSTVKRELADQFASYSEAKMELFDYLEVFYNQRRRHSTLGQISPATFERRAMTHAA